MHHHVGDLFKNLLQPVFHPVRRRVGIIDGHAGINQDMQVDMHIAGAPPAADIVALPYTLYPEHFVANPRSVEPGTAPAMRHSSSASEVVPVRSPSARKPAGNISAFEPDRSFCMTTIAP